MPDSREIPGLSDVLQSPVVVLCVGNRMRGDDGFGPAVAALLSDLPNVIDAGTTPENELPRIARMAPTTVIVVDAVHFDGAPGELRVIAPENLRFDDVSTHAGSLELCAEFLRESCGARTVLLAAQPVSLDLTAGLSDPISVAVDEAVAVLRRLDVP